MHPALKLILLKGVGFSLPAFMAAQSDGFWHDFSATSRLFQGTDETTPVTAVNDVIGRVNDRRTGANSPRNATQATASFKPKYQTTGAAFDGTDDNLLTGYTAGATANFMVAKVAVPASLSSSQIVAGALATTHFYLALTTAGYARGGAGSTVLTDTQDLRGAEALIGFSNDGATMRLFVNGAMVAEGLQTNAVPGAAPFRLGALNNSGTASNFFGGSIKNIVAGREFIDLARFNQIAAAI